jgi:hypothetical protein
LPLNPAEIKFYSVKIGAAAALMHPGPRKPHYKKTDTALEPLVKNQKKILTIKGDKERKVNTRQRAHLWMLRPSWVTRYLGEKFWER